ncbi:hypothetical protein BX616_001423 [Lobosporangium transversale]|uniref:Uncharacterized protein n=1 Tax=Lobosporangium transversale TaxID=64571 RepID=A0A1Y2G7S6_9FUNG|nr:hypothetical protein BCR41DRAFT_364455 [Lobosporangium transversale]KAF9917297.1 hypothetical protein BX616_001423 [Lobosporangium transversale]ORY98278.1 hypothetical protein BCR41DRAFT_364455 [Lobosporangium transversale]|eukprot:XP_021875707.1 hypothetical protein BCR41DRAFT_364455 [Lobosporangium transversale]
MADDDSHEQTPLLEDQEGEQGLGQTEQNPEGNDSFHTRAHEVISNVRDVIENQIPNGHHTTPPSSPKKIHALLPRLFGLLNSLVDSVNVEDDIVTDDVVEFMAGFGKEVVYCLLRCVETYMREGERDVGRKKLLERRAQIAQVAAVAITKVFVDKDMMATYCHVLTRPFFAVGEEPNTAENAIEIAIRVHATDFLADVEIQRCVQALWNGLILQTEDDHCRVRFVEYSGVRRSRHLLWEWIDIGRLNVPKYQNNIKIAIFIIFLIMYTIVVNDRTKYPSFIEWGVYIFVCGFVFEEARLIFEGGTAFFLGSLWHWINIISYSMFLVSFAFRFTACYLMPDSDNFDKYNDIAYDLLACLAIFLWIKTLSLLDGLQYFGTMIMVLQRMLKDGIMFFWFLAWVYIGFFQSFYALERDEEKNFRKSTMLLVKGFLQDPDWETAEAIDERYGNFLFGLYLFLTSIILLNLLIALFNSSYTNITDSAEKEYLALFTFKVFSYLKSPDEFPYAAPFNLLEVFFVIPLSYVLSKTSYRKLNRGVMGPLFCIPILIIALAERRRYLYLSNTNEENKIQGGRRVYRHLTEDDANAEDVDDLFLLATQELGGNESEAGNGGSRANSILRAEEGVIAAGTDDLWTSSRSPLESFEDFRERRIHERESKKSGDKHLKDLIGKPISGTIALPNAEQASSSVDGGRPRRPSSLAPGEIDHSQGQLTDTLVQSLLASLARMENRQKALEATLQTYIDNDKQAKAISQATKLTSDDIDLGNTEEQADPEQEVPEEEEGNQENEP